MQTRIYIYDTKDRLIEVRDSNSALIASYIYDPFNRRIIKETAGSTSTMAYYFYAEEGIIAEADNTGTVTKTYGYRSHTKYKYETADGACKPCEITDVQEEVKYTPFSHPGDE